MGLDYFFANRGALAWETGKSVLSATARISTNWDKYTWVAAATRLDPRGADTVNLVHEDDGGRVLPAR
jgi:hypothetical protein